MDIVCHRCGKKGHTAKKCTLPSNDPLWNTCVRCGRKGHFVKDCPKPPSYSLPCNICNQPGHWANECPMKKHERGNQPCFFCKEIGHWSKECPETKHKKAANLEKTTHPCFACGQFGHWAKECTDALKFGKTTVIRISDVYNGISSPSTIENEAKLTRFQEHLASFLQHQQQQQQQQTQLAHLQLLQEQLKVLYEKITGKPLISEAIPSNTPPSTTPAHRPTKASPYAVKLAAQEKQKTVGVVVQVVPKRKKERGETNTATKRAKTTALSCLVDYQDEGREKTNLENELGTAAVTNSTNINTTKPTETNSSCHRPGTNHLPETTHPTKPNTAALFNHVFNVT